MDRLTLYFDVADPMPTEYLELHLCRDVYHCMPDELAHIPVAKIGQHLICAAEELKRIKHG